MISIPSSILGDYDSSTRLWFASLSHHHEDARTDATAVAADTNNDTSNGTTDHAFKINEHALLVLDVLLSFRCSQLFGRFVASAKSQNYGVWFSVFGWVSTIAYICGCVFSDDHFNYSTKRTTFLHDPRISQILVVHLYWTTFIKRRCAIFKLEAFLVYWWVRCVECNREGLLICGFWTLSIFIKDSMESFWAFRFNSNNANDDSGKSQYSSNHFNFQL